MTDDHNGLSGQATGGDDLVEIDLNFESMRRFQAEFSPNLSKGGLFIDTGEPLSPGSVVRFRVILPEEFVFLEGTSVVEWIRGAEAISDGAPGMALRFVTLSSQNQELVEQLVQDFVDTGGTPFDLDVRPVPADFPTDSLEGAPAPPTDAVDEGYRLTVRHTGPGLQADALQALSDAVPDSDDQDAQMESMGDDAPDFVEFESAVTAESNEVDAGVLDAPVPVEEEAAAEDVRGFEIVSSDSADMSPTVTAAVTEVEAVPVVEETVTEDDGIPTLEETIAEFEEIPAVEESPAEVEAIGDPPEFDWSAEMDAPSEVDEIPELESPVVEVEAEADPREEPDEILVVEQEALSFPTEDADESAEILTASGIEDAVAIPDVLPPPTAFDEGPEVIEDVNYGDLGSPAFDVSLPEHDDEPDTTPMLPDEGGDEVTVTTGDDFEAAPTRRRRWPLALAALFVVAVGGGFLWPQARDWLASRDDAPAWEPATVEDAQVAEQVPVPAGEKLPDQQAETSDTTDRVVDGAPAGDTGEAATAESEEPGTAADAVVERVEPEPTRAVVQLASADTVTTIEVEPGQSGTVIRIRANGSLEDGVFSMETLSAPPRVLIRVRGVTNSYRPYTIDAMTPEVAQIRSGLHEERRPSELWIVVDLAEPDVAVGGVSIGRDLAELVLERP